MSTGKSEGLMLARKLTAMLLSPCTPVLVSSPAAPRQRQLKVILVDSSRTHSHNHGEEGWWQELEEAGNSAFTGRDTGWAPQHSAEDRGRRLVRWNTEQKIPEQGRRHQSRSSRDSEL